MVDVTTNQYHGLHAVNQHFYHLPSAGVCPLSHSQHLSLRAKYFLAPSFVEETGVQKYHPLMISSFALNLR